MELIAELFTALGEAAFQHAHYEIIEHDGPTARYLMRAPDTGAMFVAIVGHGETVAVMRWHRLLVQDIDAIPSASISSWSTT